MDAYDKLCRTYMRQGKSAASAMKLARAVVGRSKGGAKLIADVQRTNKK